MTERPQTPDGGPVSKQTWRERRAEYLSEVGRQERRAKILQFPGRVDGSEGTKGRLHLRGVLAVQKEPQGARAQRLETVSPDAPA